MKENHCSQLLIDYIKLALKQYSIWITMWVKLEPIFNLVSHQKFTEHNRSWRFYKFEEPVLKPYQSFVIKIFNDERAYP
jgi:hypothetical protein